jgi:hypothetical protein
MLSIVMLSIIKMSIVMLSIVMLVLRGQFEKIMETLKI